MINEWIYFDEEFFPCILVHFKSSTRKVTLTTEMHCETGLYKLFEYQVITKYCPLMQMLAHFRANQNMVRKNPNH